MRQLVYNAIRTPDGTILESKNRHDYQTHILKRKVIKWGTYGINGNEPLRYVKLMEMNDGHIQACLDTIAGMRPSYRAAFIDELNFRKEVL